MYVCTLMYVMCVCIFVEYISYHIICFLQRGNNLYVEYSMQDTVEEEEIFIFKS